jgi:hypothetical protein
LVESESVASILELHAARARIGHRRRRLEPNENRPARQTKSAAATSDHAGSNKRDFFLNFACDDSKHRCLCYNDRDYEPSKTEELNPLITRSSLLSRLATTTQTSVTLPDTHCRSENILSPGDALEDSQNRFHGDAKNGQTHA